MKVIYPKNFSPSRNKIILDYCKWKKVLHIWACDAPFTEAKYNWETWPLLYREIDKVCSKQLWIDLDKESISFLNSKKEYFPNSEVKFFNMNKLEDLDFEPEVIIFGEVIEHLMNLETALSNLKKVMNKDTLLIISTPNAFSINNFINALFWFEYIHEDHKITFTYWTIKILLKFNWINIDKFYFTKLDRTFKYNLLWKIINYIWKTINKIFISTNETLLIIWKTK